jgi:adenosine deaminase
MRTSLVFCLDRTPGLRDAHYRLLRDFCAARSNLADNITGIDFAGWEEDFPPELNRQFINQVFADNLCGKKIDLLHHVGESFSTLSIASALRWIYSLAEMGLSRLGHAIALGCSPDHYLGKTVDEERREFDAHQAWLKREEGMLRNLGYTPDYAAQAGACAESAPGKVTITYTRDYIADIKVLQHALARFIREKEIVIESCPTSNSRLAAGHKPLQFFVEQGIKVVLGSDDPGIFASDWQQEADLAEEICGERERFMHQAELLGRP